MTVELTELRLLKLLHWGLRLFIGMRNNLDIEEMLIFDGEFVLRNAFRLLRNATGKQQKFGLPCCQISTYKETWLRKNDLLWVLHFVAWVMFCLSSIADPTHT